MYEPTLLDLYCIAYISGGLIHYLSFRYGKPYKTDTIEAMEDPFLALGYFYSSLTVFPFNIVIGLPLLISKLLVRLLWKVLYVLITLLVLAIKGLFIKKEKNESGSL